MAPAFGAAEIKDLLPSFMKIVNKVRPFLDPIDCEAEAAGFERARS